MILILGGTTEGRIAASIVDEGEKTFYYSTKGNEQEIALKHGIRLTGALDKKKLIHFCREKEIQLIIDAAHPFAKELHDTVYYAADELNTPVIRYERIYPNLDTDVDGIFQHLDYDCVMSSLRKDKVRRLLTLTGVKSIAKLKPYWKEKGVQCYCRILDRDSSRELALNEEFPEENLVYDTPDESLDELLKRLRPEAVLIKESGISGGFLEKTAIIRQNKIPIYLVNRPQLKPSARTVDGEYGLRATIDEFLPQFFPLHTGISTGTCATAAARFAYAKILSPSPYVFIGKDRIPVILPGGETIPVQIHSFSGSFSLQHIEATVSVRKNGGSDPDVTHGMLISATVSIEWDHTKELRLLKEGELPEIIFHAGEGVGTVTLPGLGLEVGEPAINATPRKMIRENFEAVIERACVPVYSTPIHVTISVEGGKEIAARTFNPRLGIEGGISIIGTSGIVRPFSSEAFVNAIRKEMEVAQATGAPRIVINSGAKSERMVRNQYPDLPPQAFVHYGNFIGETIQIASELGIERVTLGVMIGKAVKLAEGHLDTHSKQVTMNREFLATLAHEAGCSGETVSAITQLTLARELWTLLTPSELTAFTSLLISRCAQHCQPLLPNGELTILLISEEGVIYS